MRAGATRGAAVARLCLLLPCLLLPAAAAAQNASPCEIPGYLTITEGNLPKAAAEIRAVRKLTVAVVGTASSTLAGPDGPAGAYPARLEATLRRRLGDVEVVVKPYVQTRQTSGAMLQRLGQVIDEAHPSLLIWQTGTVDAIRGVSTDELQVVLSKGVDAIRAGGADPLFVNMQYSPRTESMIALSDYIDIMRLVSQEKAVPLFDRYAIMRYWFDTSRFDLYARARGMALARRVHECLGQTLASLIIDTLPRASLGLQVKP